MCLSSPSRRVRNEEQHQHASRLCPVLPPGGPIVWGVQVEGLTRGPLPTFTSIRSHVTLTTLSTRLVHPAAQPSTLWQNPGGKRKKPKERHKEGTSEAIPQDDAEPPAETNTKKS